MVESYREAAQSQRFAHSYPWNNEECNLFTERGIAELCNLPNLTELCVSILALKKATIHFLKPLFGQSVNASG